MCLHCILAANTVYTGFQLLHVWLYKSVTYSGRLGDRCIGELRLPQSKFTGEIGLPQSEFSGEIRPQQ